MKYDAVIQLVYKDIESWLYINNVKKKKKPHTFFSLCFVFLLESRVSHIIIVHAFFLIKPFHLSLLHSN